jgi:hypothetical protein
MAGPQTVDVITDGPPTSATTTIFSSYVRWPQRIVVGPVWLNAKSDQFGAVGDGVTDDTTAIQAALNAASAAGGGIVVLPNAGATKYVFSNLTVPGHVTLRMHPGGIIYTTPGTPPTAPVQPHALLRKAASTGTAITVAQFGALENVVFDGNNVGGATDNGVLLNGNNRVDGVFVFRHGGHGVHLASSSSSDNVRRVWAGFNGGIGLIIGTSDSIVSDVRIYSNTSDGIYFDSGANNNTLVGGKSEFNSAHNLEFFTNSDNYVSNLILDRSVQYAVKATGGAVRNYLVNCEFARSFSSTTAGAHIFMDNSSRLNVVGGSFRHGKNDDGTGNDTPANVVDGNFNPSTLTLVGCDLTTASVTGFAGGGGGSITYGPFAVPGALQPAQPTGLPQTGTPGSIYMGSGVPANANGNNGDFYFRMDTPGTANQRLYVRSAGAWVALTL